MLRNCDRYKVLERNTDLILGQVDFYLLFNIVLFFKCKKEYKLYPRQVTAFIWF